MNFKNFTNIGLTYEKKQLVKYRDAVKVLPQGRITCKKNKNGRRQYYITIPNSDKSRYANIKLLPLVYKIKQRKKAEVFINILENNIAVREYVLENYLDYSIDTVENMLPKAYKNDDWLNEKVLGNSPGKQRVHQSQNPYKPEELKHITSFNLRVRSKGRLDDRNYMLRDLKKTQLYFRNGIFEPHNLIVTTDGPDNMTDMEAISRIINGILMPLMGI